VLKNFLITGGSGFIGSHFVELLLSKDKKIINVDLKNDKILNIKNKNYKFKKGNICNYKFLNKIVDKKIDCIVNFAAQTHVDRSIDFPEDFVKNNILGTFNLLEIIRKKKLNTIFVQISTDEVFGSLSKNQKSFNEKSQIKPNSPYSASKASADHIVRSYNKTFGFKTIITHSSNNYGERQHPEKLIPLSIMQLINKKKIPIYGSGQNIRDWIYVKDNCKCIYAIINKKIFGESYLIGSKNEVSNIFIVKKIVKFFNQLSKIPVFGNGMRHVKDRKGHDFRYAINNKKIKNLINFNFSNFDEKIKNVIIYYLKNSKYYQKELNKKWLKEKVNIN
jgi:dTDP-glucose 4,6-dehydratase|tara:strand:+ start:417 stop:1418 length:1002 start_codon:yes stop_codon:yes gene_type:complete